MLNGLGIEAENPQVLLDSSQQGSDVPDCDEDC